MPKKKPRESHLWQVDPSVFEPLRKAGLIERHLLSRSKSFAKHALYTLAFIYPLVLVILGVMFGGLVFWASFGGSFALIFLVIRRAGYSRNFAGWDIGYRKFVGLFGAFGVALALVYGLINIGLIPTASIFSGILITALISSIWGSEILQLFEGRLNKFSGTGLAMLLGSLALVILIRNQSTVLVHNPSVTLHILDVEYLALSIGAVLGLAGVSLTVKPPKKTIAGCALWVSLLLYTIVILPLTGWKLNTLSILALDSVLAVEYGVFFSGLVLIMWGLQEYRASRTRPGQLPTTRS